MAGETARPSYDEEIRLGLWRRSGRAAFSLARLFDEDGRHTLSSPPDLTFAAIALMDISALDSTLRKAQDYFGDSLLDVDHSQDEYPDAFNRFYRYSPLARSELQSLTGDDRQALERAVVDSDKDLVQLDERLRHFAERTLQWFTAGEREYDPGYDEFGLAEGPNQVRRAAAVLFHYLADDRFVYAGYDYEPPDYTNGPP